MVKASDLIKEQQEKNNIRKKIYRKVYDRIEKKILQLSNVDEYQCWYEIPEFILGIPLYSFIGCKEYILNRLYKNGFKAQMLSNSLLYVDWSP